MLGWEIAAAHLDLMTPCWRCWLGSRWRHGLNQTACKILAVELFLQISDSLQIKAQMIEKLLSQAIPFSHIFYVIYSFINSATIDHKGLVHQMSLSVCTQGICSAHTRLGLAMFRRALDSFRNEKNCHLIWYLLFSKFIARVLRIVVLGMSCHLCPVCRFGGRSYPSSCKFPVS